MVAALWNRDKFLGHDSLSKAKRISLRGRKTVTDEPRRFASFKSSSLNKKGIANRNIIPYRGHSVSTHIVAIVGRGRNKRAKVVRQGWKTVGAACRFEF